MLNALIERIRTVSETLGESLAQQCFVSHPELSDMMCDLQRAQLMDGLRSDGQNIVPSMRDDPFFKGSDKAVGKYAMRKARMFPSRREFYTPNLKITGYFHEGFRPVFDSQSVFMDNSNKNVTNAKGRSENLYEKYGEETFGLTDENWETVLEQLGPLLIESIKEQL